jgi:hypothetical protein
MSIVKVDEIAAYTDGERIFSPESIEDTSGLRPIFRNQISEGEELVCDVTGLIV